MQNDAKKIRKQAEIIHLRRGRTGKSVRGHGPSAVLGEARGPPPFMSATHELVKPSAVMRLSSDTQPSDMYHAIWPDLTSQRVILRRSGRLME